MKKISIPKKYSTLLIQALFIFVAVFLSFLADDYRDYLNTRAMERESLEGIYENLKMDSLAIERNIGVLKAVEQSGAGLLKMVDTKRIAIDTAELYFHYTLTGEMYKSNKSHYETLKHSGLIQEIRDITLRNKLTAYYEEDINWLSDFSDLYQKRHLKFIDQIKPFLKIRPASEKKRGLYEIQIIDENYMLNEPLWQNSLGESLGLLKVRIGTLRSLSKETQQIRQMILKELD